MTRSVDDFLNSTSSGKPYIKFNNVSDKLVGELVEARIGYERDYNTGETVTWPDGSPKEQLQLDIRIDWSKSTGITTGSDGEQAEVGTIYCKYLQQKAVAEACKAKGLKLSEVGPFAMVRLPDGQPRNPRNRPPHQFAAEVDRRVASAGVDSLLGGMAQAEPEPAPQPATPPAAPAPGSLLGG